MKTFKNLAVLSLFAVGTSAFAQFQPTDTAVTYNGPSQQAPIAAMYRIDEHGNQIGPVITPSNNETPQAQLFDRGFDFVHSLQDGSNFSYLVFSATVYTGMLFYYNPTTTLASPIFDYVNDMDIAPAAYSRVAQRIRSRVQWGPEGVALVGGAWTFNPMVTPKNPVLDYYLYATYFEDANGASIGDFLGGWRVILGTTTGLAGGFYHFSSTAAEGSGFGLPLPANTRAAVRKIHRKAVYDSGTASWIVSNLSAPESAQPGWRTVCSPTDPLYPGTNPSDSTSSAWVDFDGNYAWEGVYNMNDATYGNLQPCDSMFFDTNLALKSGTVLFGDWAGATIQSVDVDLQAIDANDTPVAGDVDEMHYGLLADGTCKLMDPMYPSANGRYILSFKRTHWLRMNTIFDFNGTGTFSVTLINGDVDGDNEVGPGDFSELSTAFGSMPGDANWNEMADLDGDGEVGPNDFSVLSTNFGLTGDDDYTP